MNKYLNGLLKYPMSILIVTLAVSAFFFYQMKENIRMETDLDEYMPKSHPAFMYSEEAESWFNIKDGIIIAIEAPENIYNSVTLEKIKDLTRALQKMEQIEPADVTSLYTADNIVGNDGSLEVNAFYKKIPKSEIKLQELRQSVESNEMVHSRIVSKDGRTALIIAQINDDVFSEAFYEELLTLVKSFEGPEKLYIAGSPIVEGTLAKLMPADMKKMVPLVVAVIFVVLLLLLRSFIGSLLILLSVVFSSVWTFGLMGWLGIPLYSVSTMIPVMLIAIGVAYGIHLLNSYNLIRRDKPDYDKKQAVSAMITAMVSPVSMAAFTTMVGFFSLISSQVYPIKYFGIFTAFGVFVELLLSLLFLSASILLFGSRKTTHSKKDEDYSEKSAPWLINLTEWLPSHRVLIMMSITVILLIAFYGASRIWIDSSFLDKFEKDSNIVQTDAFINQHFGGTSTLNVILEGSPEAMKQPATLLLMEKMQTSTESRNPLVGSSFSLSDYLKRMNKVMHADDPAWETIPESSDMIAQYLLLYEMSGDPDKLWKLVDYNYAKANITFQLKSDNSKALEQAMESVESFHSDFAALNIELNYAGSGYKAYVFTDLILKGQISSLLISVLIVIILLALMFRSIAIGLLGALPIIITSIISFGVMGFLNIPLSTTTALISSIAVGIGIDYAVHFIDKYRKFFEKNKNLPWVSLQTMVSSGRAILFNALVVIAGFMVLLASVFPPNRTLGALISLNMLVSFLATMSVLYILLRKYYENKTKQISEQESAELTNRKEIK
ncbi:MAG TPA: RND family transporter [Candidatus Marinimicrobia bacterium]|nr:RND family transporter [Candidatus Neomarinimicrobiota bacterium]